MMIFFEDTKIMRSTLARMALYSVSSLDVGKSNRIVCSILSPVGAISCKTTPALICREAPSTLRIH